MIYYHLNFMGPINEKFIRENGEYWAAGRIDIYGVPDEPYGLEYSVPIMHVSDWNKLSLWLREYKTEELVSFNTIIEEYQKENTPIQWFSKCE